MLAVYGKHKNDKRFRGFNFDNGTFEPNKINITVFTNSKEVRNRLQNEVDFMNEQNKEYTFEISEI